MPKKIKNVFFKSLTFQKFLEAHNRAKKNKMYKFRGKYSKFYCN